MTSSTFFINLYQRPIQANPVVALKGLITTLKLLQQGPEHFLCECVRRPPLSSGPPRPIHTLSRRQQV